MNNEFSGDSAELARLLAEQQMGRGDSFEMPFWYWIGVAVVLVSSWKIFEKAGKAGWAAIVPVYGTLVWLEIIRKPWWWLLLLLVPVVNIVIAILATHETSKVFGKDGWFTLGLILLPVVFYPILAFGDAKYHKAS